MKYDNSSLETLKTTDISLFLPGLGWSKKSEKVWTKDGDTIEVFKGKLGIWRAKNTETKKFRTVCAVPVPLKLLIVAC